MPPLAVSQFLVHRPKTVYVSEQHRFWRDPRSLAGTLLFACVTTTLFPSSSDKKTKKENEIYFWHLNPLCVKKDFGGYADNDGLDQPARPEGSQVIGYPSRESLDSVEYIDVQQRS